MNKLYPPYISGTLPAFTGTELTIPFQMNQTVSAAEVSGFAYIFKTIQSNVVIAQGQIVSSQAQDAINSGSITFQLKFKQINGNAFQLNLGQSYKVQLAYIDNNKVIGYYSTVGIAKYTTDPKVEIEGLEPGGIGINKTNFIGHYSQYNGDVTERVYSYQFIVYDEYHNIFATSGEQLHNTINDEQLYESYDSFELNKELIKGKNYYIQYKVTTINNYEAASPEYRIINRETIDPEIRATLQAVMDENNGFAQINLKGIKDALNNPIFNGKRVTDYDSIIQGHVHFNMEDYLDNTSIYTLRASGVGYDKDKRDTACYYILKEKKDGTFDVDRVLVKFNKQLLTSNINSSNIPDKSFLLRML